MIKTTQIELGNVIYGKNYRGEDVTRRLVGGVYGTVEKWFLIDPATYELKSRVRENKEEVLEGFEIEAVSDSKFVESGEVVKNIEEYVLGDLFYSIIDGSLTARQVVGGCAYDNTVYFAIDPHTGKRCSRTKETVEEVLEGYDVEFIIR